MAYSDLYLLARGADAASAFRQQVHIAMLSAAADIIGEAQGALSNLDWQKRHRFCVALLNDPDGHIQRLCDAVAAKATLSATPTDLEVQTAVNSLISDLAGVGLADWL